MLCTMKNGKIKTDPVPKIKRTDQEARRHWGIKRRKEIAVLALYRKQC